MRYLAVIFFIGLVAIHPTYAQEVQEPKCEIMEFGSSLHTPFRIAINHDPAVRQLVEETHGDPQSLLNFDKTEKTFSIFSNSTDDWTIKVDLGFKDILPLDQKREIVLEYTSANEIFTTNKRFLTGNDYCVKFIFFASPPPHIPTSEETLQLLSKYQDEYFKNIVERFDAAIVL